MTDTIAIRSLAAVTLDELHRSSLKAFEDYPVDVRMTPDQLDFYRHDLLGTLAEAARKVAGNPRHTERG